MFFIIVLTIMIQKYVDELNSLNEEDIDIDVEQALFNLVNNLINQKLIGIVPTNVFYYCSHLIMLLASATKNLDYYINIEKYILKAKGCIQNLELLDRTSEVEIFKETLIFVLGELLYKTKNVIISKQEHSFYIHLVFSSFIKEKEILLENVENIKNIFKTSRTPYNKDNKSDTIVDDVNFDRILMNLKKNIDSFYKYLFTFTTDVSTGKKIWKEIEYYVLSLIMNQRQCNDLLQIFILYIFNKIKLLQENEKKNKIIISSIFEFLCDKFNYSNKNIPIDENEHCTSMFYDIVCNHYETISTHSSQLFTERYMYYFARIFIEDCLNEILTETNLNNEKLLQRLYIIIVQNDEPLKLFISFISILAKLFVIQENTQFDNNKQKDMNLKLLETIYKKLNIFFVKYSNFHVKERCALDRDELFNIITNFSTQYKELKGHFLKFFIQFFIYVEVNYILELEFTHRKKLYIIVFELLYELITDTQLLGGLKQNMDEFIKLTELLIILLKNFSNNHIEDAYLIYKMLSIVMKKLQMNSETLCNSLQLNLVFMVPSFTILLIARYILTNLVFIN
jgi:hypothetical protein